MKNFNTMKDARRVAREVLAGSMDPHLGCGLIGGIGEKLNHHPMLSEFIHIAHLFEGPGHVGFTRESLLPDIMAACRELAAVQA
ncbi:MAG: hypothetical protein ACT4NL_13925 [Pseudomarimonas sp.]